MELKPVIGKVKKFLIHYKYAVIVLIAGLLLMLLPTGKKNNSAVQKTTSSNTTAVASVEDQLVNVLRQIKGVGEVRLLLTLENSGETIFQSDRDTTVNQDNQTNQLKTVIITDADRNQTGLVRKTNSPTYRGAVVVCSGGDDPNVQLAVTQAVMRSTNLKADQICVLKMK